MGGYKRVFAIAVVFGLTSVAWMVLGGVTALRKEHQSGKLRGSVQELWGSSQTQRAPRLTFEWQTQELTTRTETEGGRSRDVQELQTQTHQQVMPVASTQVDVALASDLRRKGLMWYSLYDVRFGGVWSYTHQAEQAGVLNVYFAFPDRNAIYDHFRFTVDGADHSAALQDNGEGVLARVPVQPGQRLQVEASYKSRGLDEWRYAPTDGVGRLERFVLNMTTNFADIDFPAQTLSPSQRAVRADGATLSWRFDRIVSGFGIGMVLPQRIQPGELASMLSFSAPVSLFFFFGVLYVLSTLRRIDLHPVNYVFIAAAFFAFHVLFAYLVDHVTVEQAFLVCSVVSMVLVTTYLRLVVSSGFAFREAAAAQLVYLVGFSMAHFWEGFTGLTVTVLAIATLFLLMQLTGRMRWSEVFTQRPPHTL